MEPRAFARKITSCPEFSALEFHPQAGQINGDKQYFFDGSVTVYPFADDENQHLLLRLTKGVTEPQEMLPFLEIVKKLPEDATMMELGAGQALYSIVLGRRLSKARLILVEGNPRNIEITRENMKLNGLIDRSTIIHAAVTDEDGGTVSFRESGYGSAIHPKGEYQVPTVSVDGLMKRLSLPSVNVVHMDVQRSEVNVINGMSKALTNKAIDYILIGTHGCELHVVCETLLSNFGYKSVLSLDSNKSVSGDGILICTKGDYK
jgi:FkbM family methyltransferase